MNRPTTVLPTVLVRTLPSRLVETVRHLVPDEVRVHDQRHGRRGVADHPLDRLDVGAGRDRE
ncbi:hypothetical protein [Actinoplanes italicus]|uniref:hypothetical protein n=1 Tax=Actinoplanes italicus TaxID=113567 RepID=UPI0027DE545D|nr:hypothetical protein [Actinoplanes italicus]